MLSFEPSPEHGGLIWLASFPKSGNTWTRAFLTAYCCPPDKEEDPITGEMSWISSIHARFPCDHMMGLPSSDLLPEEIFEMRASYHQELAESLENEEVVPYKVHDAYLLTVSGRPLFPPSASRGVVYLLRNPLDVAVSYSFHMSQPVDAAISVLNCTHRYAHGALAGAGPQYENIMLGWSGHALSWLDQTEIPVTLARYEDLKRDPEEIFGRIVEGIGLPLDQARLRAAIDATAFDKLKAEEEKHGFDEKPHGMKTFFRQGRSGSWREHLTEEQVARILEKNAPVMRRFGYLDDAGQPVVGALPLAAGAIS